MSGTFFFAVTTIGLSTREGRKPSTLLNAARHNRRQIQAELGADGHIDSTRMHLNQVLAGPATPAGVVELATSLMAGAGLVAGKLRKDHVQAVELLFSVESGAAIDTGSYFLRCVDWARERFGAVNILTADVHYDEAAPHLHILILPLVDGRMCGSGLLAKRELAELRAAFARDVARGFGLKAPPPRLSGAMRARAARLVVERLESTHDPIVSSALWQCARQAIERDPAPFMAALGIDTPAAESARKPKTMAQIFTSAGKGPKVEPRLKPIGFENDGPKDRNLSCVGFDEKAPPASRGQSTARWGVSDAVAAERCARILPMIDRSARPAGARLH